MIGDSSVISVFSCVCAMSCVCVCVCVVSVMDDSSTRVHVVSRSPLVVSEWKTTKRIHENYIVIGNTLLIYANICCNIFHNIIFFSVFLIQ